MAHYGKNLRLTIDRALRDRTRAMFTEAFGCTVKSPTPDLEQYILEDGFSIGAFYVDGSEALAPSDQKKAPWLELLVPDPDETTRKLAALGIAPFEYTDKTHSYFVAPGGPVFRLAKRG
jgi:hypothetical protein